MNLSICLSPCPFLCPYDWKTHWKERRNHCDFVLLTPPLTEPEPRFDSPQPQVPQPVGHIREKTHHLKPKPELDSAQEKHLQHKVRIQNTTSLQTSPSRQVQELTGPGHHIRVVSNSSQDHLSLFSRETCILEKSISPDFQLKESLTSLFLSPRCLYKRVFVFDLFVFSVRADRGVDRGGSMVVTSHSRFLTSGVSDTSESLGHFAESTLLSHDLVSLR